MTDLWLALAWGMIIAAGIAAVAAIIEAAREIRRAERGVELARELFDESWGGEH